VPFPDLPEGEEIQVCYDCLRAGRGAMTKDTELGMVSWQQAAEGVTGGVPELETTGFERVRLDPEEEWYGARVPKEHLFELLRTPAYNTWQGENWLFCCRQPMTYLGEWANLMNSHHRPDDPRAFFDQIAPDEQWREWLWRRLESGRQGAGLYVFRCKACGRHRSGWDTD